MKNIGEEFIEKTKYEHLSVNDQSKGVTPPPLENDYDKSKSKIDLPSPDNFSVPEKSVRIAIEERKSLRQYSEKEMTIEELSWLLWATQGVKKVSPPYSLRNVPSAGARHPFETYILVNNVKSLNPGIYRYLAIEHKLIEYKMAENIQEKVIEGAYGQKMVALANVTFIWVAVPYRTSWRYSERSYRYLHLDAGHVCQNLYLAGEAIDCGSCAIAAFYDDKMNGILDLDGKLQFVIYLASIGKKI